MVEALQLARPDLIVAFATELNQCTNDLESFLLTYAPETSPIIVYTTDDKSFYQFNKNRRVLALNENWNAKQIKAYMIVKASR